MREQSGQSHHDIDQTEASPKCSSARRCDVILECLFLAPDLRLDPTQMSQAANGLVELNVDIIVTGVHQPR
jgi:hypothetical protein